MELKPTHPSEGVSPSGAGELPAWALAAMMFAGWLLGLWGLVGSFSSVAGALTVVLTDGIIAALVLTAAAGYGYAIYRFVAPADTPRALALATAAALGLWLLSSAVMIVGTAVSGALTILVWWPVVAVGVVLALAQAHRAMGQVRLSRHFRGASLIWPVVAVAVGMWMAGATMPPSWLGNLTADSYDILEYHLQLPREYHQAGQVATLEHNIYSHYPLGVEMLYLLSMCLRGGAYEGMYLAKLTGGLFAILAVAGAFGALAGEDDFRARAAAGLLATAPWMLYLCGVAMAEPAQLCYMTLGLLWLRRWLVRRGAREAAWVGAMAGAACSAKYLSVGLIAGPLLAVMLIVSLRRLADLRQVALAAATAAALFAPWLARNVAATGNPVFPLGTSVFGKAHLSDESAQRWRDAHAPGHHDPVPPPPDYQPPRRQFSRQEMLGRWLLQPWLLPYGREPPLSPAFLLLCLTLGTLVAMFARPRRVGAWEWSLAAVAGMQVLVWAMFTRGMPGRFISIVLPPLALLSAGGLARFSRVKEVRWLRQSGGLGGKWGTAPATILLAAAIGLNLMAAKLYFNAEIGRGVAPNGFPGQFIATHHWRYRPTSALTGGSRLAMIGEATPFYYPPGTVYATVFDEHPLRAALSGAGSPAEAARRLRAMGVTHLLVTWSEIKRLTYTYGWPADLSGGRLRRLLADWPVVKQFRPARRDENAPEPEPLATLYAVPAAEEAPSTQPTTAPATGAR